MILPSECFAADITGVRSFVSVGSFVNQKIVRLCELSIAVFADELLLGSTGRCTGCGSRGSAWRVGSTSGVRWVRHRHGRCREASSRVLVAVKGTADPLVHQEGGVVEWHALPVLRRVWGWEILSRFFEVVNLAWGCDLRES